MSKHIINTAKLNALFIWVWLSCFIISLFSGSLYAATTQIYLPAFNSAEINQWKKQIFAGETLYQTKQINNQNVLHAISNGSASGLIYKKRIDLTKTPYINWRWKIKNQLPSLKEKTKKGDDYSARIYLIINRGFFSLNNKAINYVWSSSHKKGSVWNNAYAGARVKMVSIRDNDAATDRWYSEKRNVYQDLIRYFGDKGSTEANLTAYRYIDTIALMTDTDNSQSSAESFYGEIQFSSK